MEYNQRLPGRQFMLPASTTIKLAAILCLWLYSFFSHAGTNCQQKPLTSEQFTASIQAATALHQRLERSGATLALVGRAGADLERYGLRYSHFGFALRDSNGQRWLITHLLNRCGSHRSGLFRQGLLNFFSDDLHAMDVWLIIPSAALQSRLRALLQVPQSLGQALHQAEYSVIAHPYSRRYQNSNQWGLEVLAAALAGQPAVHDRASAQRYLARSDFRADRLSFTLGERVGARLFRANIHFDDHPLHDRTKGRFEVVTVRSVFRYIAYVDSLLINRHIAMVR